ncbi:hypothetical protein JKF63_07488 [Porcisia hertigi]|uniref:UTP23 sensor motif region domain-containing protein n=1 Tax=Porcisia hertigi TaxID=2761500 RepID=A0A836LIZ5_9TRYP|nr:hypothetical protein JKF63_07488 [Porcisia hertigi]
MKRRVLRAHANKRCLRMLSAAHLIQTPVSCLSSAASGDRGYAVLCDASFLRAVLLSYWQANASATWREARRRKLRKAAATTGASEATRAGSPPKHSALSATDRSAAALAASIARIPFGELPEPSPYAFLTALLCEAFQGESRSPAGSGYSATGSAPHANTTPASKFHLYCLPETVTALHRMRDSVPTSVACATASTSPSCSNPGAVDTLVIGQQEEKGSASSKRQMPSNPTSSLITPHTEKPHRMTATEAWLAASFGDLAAMNGSGNIGDSGVAHRHGGPSPSSTTFPLTFQEVPAAVVDHLLSRITLIELEEEQRQPHHRCTDASDSHEASGSTEQMGASVQLSTRNESKAIGNFMFANDICLGRLSCECVGTTVAADASPCDLKALRLVSMPPFMDHNALVYSPHSAAAKRRRRSESRKAYGSGHDGVGEASNLSAAHASTARLQNAQGGGRSSANATKSRPYYSRAFFVATQSHDVRRRLAAVTPLLRLTTNPDALWVEQRGTAYRYAEDDVGASRLCDNNRAVSNRFSSSVAAAPSSLRSDRRKGEFDASRRVGFSRTPPSQYSSATTTTVVAAAPKLTRADVAFMKHLGTATEVPLPEKSTHHPPPSLAFRNAVSDKAPVNRKRRRQKGQNPLSMKKRQKREVFRAN